MSDCGDHETAGPSGIRPTAAVRGRARRRAAPVLARPRAPHALRWVRAPQGHPGRSSRSRTPGRMPHCSQWPATAQPGNRSDPSRAQPLPAPTPRTVRRHHRRPTPAGSTAPPERPARTGPSPHPPRQGPPEPEPARTTPRSRHRCTQTVRTPRTRSPAPPQRTPRRSTLPTQRRSGGTADWWASTDRLRTRFLGSSERVGGTRPWVPDEDPVDTPVALNEARARQTTVHPNGPPPRRFADRLSLSRTIPTDPPEVHSLRRHQLATRDHARSPVAHGRGLFLGEHGFPGETSEPSEAPDTADSQALLRHWHPTSAPRTDDSRRPPLTTGHHLTAPTPCASTDTHITRSRDVPAGHRPVTPVSGGRGIRTHEPEVNPVNGFQDRPLYRR